MHRLDRYFLETVYVSDSKIDSVLEVKPMSWRKTVKAGGGLASASFSEADLVDRGQRLKRALKHLESSTHDLSPKTTRDQIFRFEAEMKWGELSWDWVDSAEQEADSASGVFYGDVRGLGMKLLLFGSLGHFHAYRNLKGTRSGSDSKIIHDYAKALDESDGDSSFPEPRVGFGRSAFTVAGMVESHLVAESSRVGGIARAIGMFQQGDSNMVVGTPYVVARLKR